MRGVEHCIGGEDREDTSDDTDDDGHDASAGLSLSVRFRSLKLRFADRHHNSPARFCISRPRVASSSASLL